MQLSREPSYSKVTVIAIDFPDYCVFGDSLLLLVPFRDQFTYQFRLCFDFLW